MSENLCPMCLVHTTGKKGFVLVTVSQAERLGWFSLTGPCPVCKQTEDLAASRQAHDEAIEALKEIKELADETDRNNYVGVTTQVLRGIVYVPIAKHTTMREG